MVGSGPIGEGNVLSGSSKGLTIDGSGSVSNTIIGNYIGVDVTGSRIIANEWQGIAIMEDSDYTIVGKTSPGLGNVISGNPRSGILVWSNHNQISGNFIGVDANGTITLPNSIGIDITHDATHNSINNNVISGNGPGIQLSGNGTVNNTISNNKIGTDPSGTGALGNIETGIWIGEGASYNSIGTNNIIAFNGKSGIEIRGSNTLHNTVTRNSIHSNAGDGISLSEAGNTGLANPSITNYSLSGNTVSGLACPNCIVEIFSDNEDEGRKYEGSTNSGADGQWTIIGLPTGPILTATTTDLTGNTSEFSLGLVVAGNTQVTVDPALGGSLVYTDSQSYLTTIDIPSGAISQTTTMVYTPLTTIDVPTGFAFVDHAFELEAYQSGESLPNFTYSKPVTVTIRYSAEDVVGLNEETLVLDYWDKLEGKWVNAATTCTPQSEYWRLPEENSIAVGICHLSQYAVFGKPHLSFVPMLVRQ